MRKEMIFLVLFLLVGSVIGGERRVIGAKRDEGGLIAGRIKGDETCWKKLFNIIREEEEIKVKNILEEGEVVKIGDIEFSMSVVYCYDSMLNKVFDTLICRNNRIDSLRVKSFLIRDGRYERDIIKGSEGFITLGGDSIRINGSSFVVKGEGLKLGEVEWYGVCITIIMKGEIEVSYKDSLVIDYDLYEGENTTGVVERRLVINKRGSNDGLIFDLIGRKVMMWNSTGIYIRENNRYLEIKRGTLRREEDR